MSAHCHAFGWHTAIKHLVCMDALYRVGDELMIGAQTIVAAFGFAST